MMSLELSISSVADCHEVKPSAIHCLPCEVDFRGPANVEQYFTGSVEQGKEGERYSEF